MTIAEFVTKRDGEHDPYYEVSVTEWNVITIGPGRISLLFGHATAMNEIIKCDACLIAKKGHLRGIVDVM